MSNSSYLTEPELAPLSAGRTSLRSYVDKLDNKIGYAKWKQNLVLRYNYMPLAMVGDSIEDSCQKYKAKMDI